MTNIILRDCKFSPQLRDTNFCLSLFLSTGPKVDASRVDTVLGNMGMNLSQRELQDLMKNLKVDGKSFDYY